MAEADYSMTQAAFQSDNGRFLADDRLLVRFFMKPWLDQAKSDAEKRPIYVEREYIEIRTPGNKDNVVCRPATHMDKDRFAEHYRKFKAREDQEAIEGTLLAEWPGITRSQCEELRFMNIKTVEQLATAPDNAAGRIMGFHGLKAKASKFLEAAASNATSEALAEAHRRIDELMERLDDKKPAKAAAPVAEATDEVAEAPVEDLGDVDVPAPARRRKKE